MGRTWPPRGGEPGRRRSISPSLDLLPWVGAGMGPFLCLRIEEPQVALRHRERVPAVALIADAVDGRHPRDDFLSSETLVLQTPIDDPVGSQVFLVADPKGERHVGALAARLANICRDGSA